MKIEDKQIIIKNYNPFPFLEIENMYSEYELKLIWQELEFLNQLDKLEKPEQTGAAENDDGEILVKSSRLYLDNLYKSRNISNILTVNKNIMSLHILEEFSSLCFLYKNIGDTNDDTTLIGYYDSGGYYKPHRDNALYTAITWFFKEPKKFSGGDFYFSDYDHKIEIKNNKTILFPSVITHSVDEIVMSNESDFGCGYGRYAMTQFFHLVNEGDSND
jgi:Rps23 Pro-64 3,4-dihydroxylase Tpa1-like proline 4-hydroxylase